MAFAITLSLIAAFVSFLALYKAVNVPAGATGHTGATGLSGEDGEDGVDGARGPAGPAGKDSTKGRK